MKAADEAKEGRLSAARGAEESKKLTILDIQGNVAHRFQRAKPLDNVLEFYVHRLVLSVQSRHLRLTHALTTHLR